ncbi:MAG: beta-galactosidase [Candidatus Hydrogenedentes bacterium]|nr:beta-galactosidase [Candidatus Hydrogenedentota bacterium]
MRVLLALLCGGLVWASVSEAQQALPVRCVAAKDNATGEAWRAKWIWGPVKPNGPVGLFRKQVDVRPGLRSAWAQMSGDDAYTFYVNGEIAKKGGFWWKQTDRIDVTSLLHPGQNLLGAEVMNAADPGGWLLELTLAYEDGNVDVVATDSAWRFSATPATGWANAGFDDAGWLQCVEIGSPPETAPWGYLPHESLGNRGLVEVVSMSVLDDVEIEAGAPVRGYIEIRPQSSVTASSRLVLGVKQGRNEVFNRSWELEPGPAQWPVGQPVRIELPDEAVSRYLPRGTAEFEYRLTDVAVAKSATGELVRKKVNVINKRQGTMTDTAVRPHNGAPALFINGQPAFAMWFWQKEILAQDAVAFHKAGVDVFTFCCPSYYLGPGWVGDETYDYSEFDGIMLRLLDKDPDAYAVPRIFLGAPDWWVDKYPGEACRFADGVEWKSNGWGGTKHESFASRQWKQDAGEALRRFVRHVTEAPYSDRVIGFHVTNGIYGEWHAWSATDLPDTSEPMRRALVEYVTGKYHGDEAALRRSWGDPAVTFDTVAVPTLVERHSGDVGMFRDPAKSRKVADYYACFHRVTVDAIDHFCGIVKRESAGRLLTCVFYSYAPDLDWPQEGDHRAAALAHRLENVDLFSSPHSYMRRKLGDDGLFRNYPAALALHGKLFVDEADDRTYLANDPAFTHVTTVEQSIELVRREFGNAVTHGTGLWYMDQQDTWFHDERIMAEIANLKHWGDQSMNMPRQSVAEVAVISTLDSEFYLCGRDSGNNHMTYPLYDGQIGELCRSGAPFDWFLIEDLVEGRIPPHKVYVFLDAFCLTPEQRVAIEKLKADMHTLIWFYAPGYVTQDALSLQEMERVTGMKFQQIDQGGLRINLDETAFPGEPRSFGSAKEQSPMFVPAVAAGTVWGHYANTESSALVAKDEGAWRSVYSGAPGLPAAVLRRIYSDAAVHIYCDTGDNVSVNAGWLMLHAASSGLKTVRLPRPARIHDVINDKRLGEKLREFSVDPPGGTTAIFALDPPA